MIKKTYLQLKDIEEDEESVKTCPQLKDIVSWSAQ